MPRPRLTSAFRLGAAAAAALLLAGLAPAASAAAAPAAPVPRLDWQPCASDFECARAAVPTDYRDPAGRTVELAVIRHPATDRAHRIGSLFFNPGGPGVPGTQALPAVYGMFPEQVRERFDIVSFDPRGIGESTTLGCFPDTAAEQQLLAGLPAGYPVGAAQESAWSATYARFGRQCADTDRTGLLAHLSTADTARDLDLLRAAVGDRRLSYLGTSYGSYLGTTYANLFPDRVRALVLDSAPDPVAWSTGRGPGQRALPPFLRTGGDLAATRTLDAFLDQCGDAGPAACAFAADGGPAATRAKFDELIDRLGRTPVTLGTAPQTVTFDQASAVSTLLPRLYTAAPLPGVPGFGWPALGGLLQQLWTAAPDASAPLPTGGALRQAQTLGTLCADTANPPASSHPAAAALARDRAGATGPYWVWQTQRCTGWPAEAARDRYTGPWDRPTSAPILVVGLTGDPAWPYEGSRTLADTLARGRLLTVDGYGHTALGNPSACAWRYEERYLVSGALPPAGTVCEPDRRPF
ncbi:pimeloyl-ACP methyl ester carboxylesterase [Kitasatospora sp. MAA19]|uniref:alpha/beta hydrolase n=1 Tax=Kitasatospora sp. MAA19 TaxID=3035090 RepID=UPI002476A78F|nr:alpha/beta hydrolase [Kitasatospora sp. MAA19]MDH6711032.1 pimeloyl-ACP methyl ester carboxylesterase [Kitasatospora sp. MAA19]